MAIATSDERKYALTKVAPGDYLLPSNDAQTIWRIATYEDGPSHGVDGMPKDRTFWGLWRWAGNPAASAVDLEDWTLWSMIDSCHESRASAIREALRIG